VTRALNGGIQVGIPSLADHHSLTVGDIDEVEDQLPS